MPLIKGLSVMTNFETTTRTPSYIPFTATIHLNTLPGGSALVQFFDTLAELGMLSNAFALTADELILTAYIMGTENPSEYIMGTENPSDHPLRMLGFTLYSPVASPKTPARLVVYNLYRLHDATRISSQVLAEEVTTLRNMHDVCKLHFKRLTVLNKFPASPNTLANFTDELTLWHLPGEARIISYMHPYPSMDIQSSSFDNLMCRAFSQSTDLAATAVEEAGMVKKEMALWADVVDMLFPDLSKDFRHWTEAYGLHLLELIRNRPESVKVNTLTDSMASDIKSLEETVSVLEKTAATQKEQLSRRETAEIFDIPLKSGTGKLVNVAVKAGSRYEAWQVPSTANHTATVVPFWMIFHLLKMSTVEDSARWWETRVGSWFVNTPAGVLYLSQVEFEKMFDIPSEPVKV